MRSNLSIAFITGLAFGIVGIILSIYSWTRASKLSLPISTSLPAFSTFVPLILAILTPLVSLLQRQQQSTARSPPNRSAAAASAFSFSLIPTFPTILTFIDNLLTALPAILVALSATYFTPDDVATCRLDNQWQRFWRTKNGDAIRGIQDKLQCCGYRSLADRAWPFPGSKTQGTCESVMGYSKSCMQPWKDAERQAAIMVFVSSILGFCLKTILSSRQFGTAGQVRRGNLRQPAFTRNFGGNNSVSAPRTAPALPSSESTPFSGERYTDNEAEERLTGGGNEGGQGEQAGEGQQQQQQQQGQMHTEAPRPATSHSTENPEEHDILHGGFRDSAGR